MQFIRVDITTLPTNERTTRMMLAHTTLSELRDEIHRSRLDGQQFGIMRVLFSASSAYTLSFDSTQRAADTLQLAQVGYTNQVRSTVKVEVCMPSLPSPGVKRPARDAPAQKRTRYD
jgi:hypothetical protein